MSWRRWSAMVSATPWLGAPGPVDRCHIGQLELGASGQLGVVGGQAAHLSLQGGLTLRRGGQEVGAALQQGDQRIGRMRDRMAEHSGLHRSEPVAVGLHPAAGSVVALPFGITSTPPYLWGEGEPLPTILVLNS